ncbi:MAG: hypothetical protein GC160_09280 [Acidobacteria bacterium]|nr:hypothetical protein [Acidobacteriota bacterium]
MQFVAEGRGELDPVAIEAAVRTAGAAHPGASLWVEGFLHKTYWRQTGAIPPLTVVEAPDWGGRSSSPLLGRLEKPLEVHGGPSCEVLLVRGSRQWVVVRGHHAVMDGVALREILFDIFRALRGEPLAGSVAGPLTTPLIGQQFPQEPRVPRQPERFAAMTGRPEGSDIGRVWLRRTVPVEGSGVLPRLIEAVIGAARKRSEGPWRISVPVDLRRHRPGLRSSANLTGGVEFEGGAEAFAAEEVRRRLADALASGAECRYVTALERIHWLPLGLLEWAGRRMLEKTAARDVHGLSAVVSNLNRQSLQSLAAPGWVPEGLFMIPPGSLQLPLFLSAVGHEGGLELCASAPARLATNGRLEELLTETAQALASGPGLASQLRRLDDEVRRAERDPGGFPDGSDGRESELPDARRR